MENNIIAIYSIDVKEIKCSGVPVIEIKDKNDLEVSVMDLCRVTGSTSHKIGKHIFVIKR